MIFTVEGVELERANAFIAKHNEEVHPSDDGGPRDSGAIGGSWTWRFTPTSIGTALCVRCSCGAEEDVSDYDHW